MNPLNNLVFKRVVLVWKIEVCNCILPRDTPWVKQKYSKLKKKLLSLSMFKNSKNQNFNYSIIEEK